MRSLSQEKKQIRTVLSAPKTQHVSAMTACNSEPRGHMYSSRQLRDSGSQTWSAANVWRQWRDSAGRSAQSSALEVVVLELRIDISNLE